jgi:hypothetical protein
MSKELDDYAEDIDQQAFSQDRHSSINKYFDGPGHKIDALPQIDAVKAQDDLIKRLIDCEKQDMLTLFNKVDSLEQKIINHAAKQKENYMLINDRIDEAFYIIKKLNKQIEMEK